MKGSARNFRRTGFSLIELLVVLSIVAILIGILLPTLTAARARARKVTCAAELRQIGLAVLMYRDEFNGVFPTARYMPEPFVSGDDDPPLPSVLRPHLTGDAQGDQSVFHCPGDNDVFSRAGISFMYQSELSGQRLETFLPVVVFNIPPEQILVSRDFDGGTFDLTDGDQLSVPSFHDLRNLLFADGHVGNYP
jgi:prepilin-type N-terminal cleavage/methylation domain-containing protein/prepilin-type processing-associated H-X9-DG protein